MPANVKIRGGRETARALSTLGRNSAQAKVLRQSLRPGASLMRSRTRAEAPRATGEYRRSIAVATIRIPGAAAKLVLGVRGPRARIAHLLEFGTRFMAARPHFRPAAQQNSQQAIQLFGSTIWPQIAREAQRVAVRSVIRASRRGR